jgi:hypothetical protein
MNVHIYVAPKQDATHYVLDVGPTHIMHFRNSPRRQMQCFNCGERRYARNLVAQAYFDGTYFFCKDKELCEDLRRGLPKAARRARR